MSIRSLLNRRGRPATCRPAIEVLEDRRTPTAMFSVNDVTVAEGNTGTHNAMVTVALTEPHGNSVTVNYATADGTATAGSDYTAVSGKLTFAKNEMTKTVLVPIKGDRLVESNESFTVNLSNPKGAKIADGTGVVTITDDEPYVYLTAGSVPYVYNPYGYATEGNDGTSPADFTVFLSGAYDLPVTINYSTADGTATASADYGAASGTLTFAPGQTSLPLSVAVFGDRLGEPDETFQVKLSTPNSYAQVVYDTGVATIVDDEPHITISDAYLNGTTITFTVALSAASDDPVSVGFATADGTAVAGVDYVAASGTPTFAPGETSKAITIDVLDVTATDKYFAVQLSGATANAFLAADRAYGYWYYYDPGYSDWGYYGSYGYDYGYYYY